MLNHDKSEMLISNKRTCTQELQKRKVDKW